MTHNIADALRADVGTHVRLPMPDDNERWHRFDCPYCGGDRAVISYRAGWFECHRCNKKITVKQGSTLESLLARFDAQLNQAVRNASRKSRYGMDNYMSPEDLRSHALERLWIYATPGIQGEGDSGKLDDWEIKASANAKSQAESADQLDRYVLQALNCDLSDPIPRVGR